MSLALFSTLIGLIEILVGLPFLFYSRRTAKWVIALLKQDHLVRIMGGLILLFGASVLTQEYQNFVGLNSPQEFVRLLAWVVAIKGVTLAWAPQWSLKCCKKWLTNEGILTLGALVKVALGIYLVWAGMEVL